LWWRNVTVFAWWDWENTELDLNPAHLNAITAVQKNSAVKVER